MKRVILLILLFLMAGNCFGSSDDSGEQMFSFKDKKEENYLIVHYNNKLIRFEECFRHTPCRFFGEIELKVMNLMVHEAFSNEGPSLLKRGAISAAFSMGIFLAFMTGESFPFKDADQLVDTSNAFMASTVLPALCATLPIVMDDKSKLLNTALMLEKKLFLCDYTYKEVRLSKVRASIDDLIKVLN